MVKIIYKSVLLILIFVGSLFFFGHQLETDITSNGKTVELTEETFPIIQISTQGKLVNTLYGYSATLDAGVVRESMTPLGADKTIVLGFLDDKTWLTQIQYQIIDKETKEVYDNQVIHGIGKKQKSVEINFEYAFKTSTEYILDIKGISNEGREIHYYTRLKYYLDESNLAKKLEFVKRFHDNTFDKSKREEIQNHLETTGTNPNQTLASVDISSSSNLITWGEMAPNVVSDEYINIKEYNMETACIQYNYFVAANSSSGKEIYHIKEFYRVRYVGGKAYLLNFQRNMEAAFDEKQTNVQKSQIKIGITEENDQTMITNDKENQLFFVRDGNLYKYDMSTEKITVVYSFFSEKAEYSHRAYNEQGIRLLKVDETGDLYFSAFGYFPRGRYEGDVAIVLYKYTQNGQLEEMVYMPISSTYQQLKEDFDKYGYVSSRGVYYFTVANTVYAYNMSAKRLEKVAKNVKSSSFMTIDNVNCYVWSSSPSTGYGESITIFNLENDERQTIYTPDKMSYIRLLGVIENNVVYGYVRKKDVTRLTDGTKVVPCEKVCIADIQGKVKREYAKQGCYAKSVEVKGNVMNISLCKKAGKTYVDAGEESILNQTKTEKQSVDLISKSTAKCLQEWYIAFPNSFSMKRIPKKNEGPKELMTNERVVRLEQPAVPKYYVHAIGHITESTESVGKAIRDADRQMGVVVSSNHQVVWERSGSFIQNSIGGVELVRSGNGVSNLAACADMLLKQNHYKVNLKEMSAKNESLYNMLADYMRTPVNLRGCSLEQILYFVSNNKPVIAMTSDSSAVVIGGYTNKELYLLDPEKGKETVSRKYYEKVFRAAGSRFISYMSE